MSKKPEEKQPIRMLVWGDSPATATGFATVIRGIFSRLALTDKYDIDIIGINDRGGYKDPRVHPYRVYPARTGVDMTEDFHGRPRLVASLLGKDQDVKPPWDLIFLLNDPFILEQPLPVFKMGTAAVIKQTQDLYRQKLPPDWQFKTIFYIPIDSEVKGNWINDAIGIVNYPVAYTHFGKEEILRADKALAKPYNLQLPVIYHGVDLNDFHPIKPEEREAFRQEFFGGKVKKDTFLVTAVARNQMRKDLPRTFKIFKEFQKRRPDSFLYIHAQAQDAWGSLQEYARQFKLEFGKDYGLPSKFNAGTGYPVDVVNTIYASSDAILSTTLSEGFGFYNFEGMAAGTLVVAPNNSTHPELFGYKKTDNIDEMETMYQTLRGIPVKCGSNTSEWATYGPSDYERIRPLTNVDDAVKKLIWAYDNPEKAKVIADNGHMWVKQYTWDSIAKVWGEFFEQCYADLQKDRVEITKEQNAKAQAAKTK